MNRRDFQRLCWDYQQKLIARTDIAEEATGIGDAEQSLSEVISEFQLEVLWEGARVNTTVVAETRGEERVGLLYDASGPMICWLNESVLYPFTVVWDNGHATDTLGRYETLTEAIDAGNDWISEMLSIDDDPSSAEYSYAVYQNGHEEHYQDGYKEPVAERDCTLMLGEDE